MGRRGTVLDRQHVRRQPGDAFFFDGEIASLGCILRLPEQTLPSVTTALARRPGSATEAVAQLSWSRSIFHGLSESDLDDDVWLASLGLRRTRGTLRWELAFVENLFNYNNSADFGLHVSVAGRPRYTASPPAGPIAAGRSAEHGEEERCASW